MIFLLTKGGFTGGYGINLPKSPLPTVANLLLPTWLRNLSKSTRWQPDRLILKKKQTFIYFHPKKSRLHFFTPKNRPQITPCDWSDVQSRLSMNQRWISCPTWRQIGVGMKVSTIFGAPVTHVLSKRGRKKTHGGEPIVFHDRPYLYSSYVYSVQ